MTNPSDTQLGRKARNVDDVLTRLNGMKKHHGYYQADCPVPGHQSPAGHLTITDSGDKALITCQGGGHSYKEICAALGFDNLEYSNTDSTLAPLPAATLSDYEAMVLIKQTYGLTETTIRDFCIEPDYSKQAWQYPIDGGTRYKKYDRKPPHKYWHTDGINNQFYGLGKIPEGTTEIYLVNGEPAVWVCWQAGIPATCGIFGEGNLPKDTARLWKTKGIETINLVYDLDSAGRKAAAEVLRKLSTHFQARLRQLPSELGEHGDVCDLYMSCRADDEVFRQALEGLPEMEMDAVGGEIDVTTQRNERARLVCMADIEPETISWLWHPYIPQGKVTLLEGDPGVGKSWVSLAMATAVSLGRGLPGIDATEPGRVVLASAEDGLGDTIRPRLDTLGAQVPYIHAIKGALDFGNSGLVTLREFIESVRPRLVIVDPLVAYIGAGVDLYRANETRAIMASLADMAERYRVAVLVVRHLTKGEAAKPIYRGLGSIDITAACRSVLLAGCASDNPQKRALVHIKSNLAPTGTAIGYELREGDFFWKGESDLTAEQILAASDGKGKSAMDEATEFLKEELANGPVEASQVWENAETEGLKKITVKRAKFKLGIITRRQGQIGKKGGGYFTWELPREHSGYHAEDYHQDQEDLGYHGAPKEKIDTQNISRTTDSLSLTNDDTQNPNRQHPSDRREAILRIPVDKALKIWHAAGAPEIRTEDGRITDLEKCLLHSDVAHKHLLATRRWLDEWEAPVTAVVLPASTDYIQTEQPDDAWGEVL